MKIFKYKLKKKGPKGITAMSIVDDPAILIDFLKLNNEELELLPEDLHDKVLKHFEEVGETHQSLVDQGYTLIATDNVINEDGKKLLNLSISSSPEEPSFLDTGDYKFRYRYSGPRDSKNRAFCAKVLDMDLIYRKEDINAMSFSTDNPDFGTYSIFKYKGSYNCRHKWVVLTYLKTNDELIPNIPGLPDQDPLATQVNPKVQYMNEKKLQLAVDTDKMIVTGPALIPNLKIFRTAESLGMDEDGYIYFDEETVREMAELFLMDEKQNSVTLGHEEVNKDLKLIESWIVDNPERDKCLDLGFQLPKGTWMVSYKVNSAELWHRIKSGEFNGFSIEATGFDHIEMEMSNELDLAEDEIKVLLEEALLKALNELQDPE